MWIPDPEVLRMGTNPLMLPGDGGQQQPLHATTRIEKAEGSDFEERSDFKEEDGDREDHGSNANPGGDEFGEGGSGGRNSRSRSEETFPRGEQGRPQDHLQHQGCYRGSEGSAPKPRHALWRVWPLQTLRTGREEKKKDIREKQRKGKKTYSEREAAKKENYRKIRNKQKRWKRRTN
ncbi:hypothetical protein NDU88_005577 [Pleurodeles waltl]|uniref:Uncharacterized protein n=1 Tax=Pleurodeles waltl TaxID=8319 RepID=A0AAV7VLH1_PLEWA|nr:hypothetical protein NDU88_005577 [Pleurodeles waltl]